MLWQQGPIHNYANKQKYNWKTVDLYFFFHCFFGAPPHPPSQPPCINLNQLVVCVSLLQTKRFQSEYIPFIHGGNQWHVWEFWIPLNVTSVAESNTWLWQSTMDCFTYVKLLRLFLPLLTPYTLLRKDNFQIHISFSDRFQLNISRHCLLLRPFCFHWLVVLWQRTESSHHPLSSCSHPPFH